MNNRRHNATAALATCLLLVALAFTGCTPSTYSVELPAPAPSAGTAAYDIPTLTRAVDWDKVPLAAVTEGF